MTDLEIIYNKIRTKQLPITDQERHEILVYIFKNSERLTLLNGIAYSLCQDWVTPSLDPIKKAVTNITISSKSWRELLETECDIQLTSSISDILRVIKNDALMIVLIWRGALAYLKSINTNFLNRTINFYNNIKIYHTRLKRNEETLQIEEKLPLSPEDKEEIDTIHYKYVLIPDVMLGTGNSISCTIDLLKNIIPNAHYFICSIVACPEGVFSLLYKYPKVHIVVNSLDRMLNENGYIIDHGLGDAGDKYFYENSIDNFIPYRHLFIDSQWQYLQTLLKGDTNNNR